MKKQTLFIVCVLLLCIRATAQQEPLNSMYLFDRMLINPAYTGSSPWTLGTIKVREQFGALNNHPSTKTFNGHSLFQKKHLGAGVKIINDKIGIQSTNFISLAAAYHLSVGGGKLSFGLESGIIKRQIEFSKLVMSANNDQAIPTSNQSDTKLDMSYGFYYQKKQAYFSFSHYHLTQPRFTYNTAGEGSNFQAHFYLMAGNVFALNKTTDLEISSLIRMVKGTKKNIDLNAMLMLEQKYGAGIQLRSDKTMALMAKVHITEGFRLAYCFERQFSKFGTTLGASHEILLSYGIKLPPPPTKKEIHPRYYF